MPHRTRPQPPAEPPPRRVGVGTMSVPGNPVCAACPALPACGEDATVHTCKSCFAKVCAPAFGSDDTVPAPDDCPKWNPVFGSAWDCGPCTKEREAIKQAHPARAHGLAATREIMKAIFGAVTARREGREPPEDTLRQASSSFVDHLMPFRHVRPTDAEFEAALVLARQLRDAAMQEVEFQDEVARNETWDTSLCEYEWAEAILLARRRHGDEAEPVAREWVLVFTDRAPWCRAWTRMPIPRRQDLVRSWGTILRAVLGRGTPEG